MNKIFNFKSSSNALALGCASLILLSFSGCEKHEGEAGAAGTATGAILGMAVSGRDTKSKLLGTAIGALAGNVIGREVGKSADEQEARDEREKAAAREELRKLHAKNQELKKDLQRQSEKWCMRCCRRVCLAGASICPYCGQDLIMEKFCRRCAAVFDADTPYSYCPYCRVGVHLSCR
jgi:hypothetical protein